MIPAKTRCPSTWTLEYSGYLMSAFRGDSYNIHCHIPKLSANILATSCELTEEILRLHKAYTIVPCLSVLTSFETLFQEVPQIIMVHSIINSLYNALSTLHNHLAFGPGNNANNPQKELYMQFVPCEKNSCLQHCSLLHCIMKTTHLQVTETLPLHVVFVSSLQKLLG